MNLQAIFDIPEICYQLGIRHAVISPGSRNGALTIAFSQHGKIECLSVPDERSAGFIALGISLKTKVPTVLICTSGSAGLNYFPAIAEAFFNRVPLLILTADRPSELIGIRDGQTIYQKEMYGRHVRAFFEISTEADLQETHEMVQSAIKKTHEGILGPVHINLPFREPFYPEEILPASNLSIEKRADDPVQSLDLNEDVSQFKKILILVGQQPFDSELEQTLAQLSKNKQIPVIADVIGNVHGMESLICHQDLILKSNPEELKPDLLITIGLSVLSKNLKIFIRNCESLEHWHVDANGDAVDTFGKLEKSIKVEPLQFLSHIKSALSSSDSQSSFYEHWSTLNAQISSKLGAFQSNSLTDISAYQDILKQLPDHTDLHLANSMAVRYVNYFGLKNKKDIEVFCNRGTSGIDGSNSTALGVSIVSEKNNVLITGDMAFLYDRNAFWHNRIPNNLKIIIINNGGGGIFRLIKGPSDHQELEPYFETEQKSNALHVCNEFGFGYFKVTDADDLDQVLGDFFSATNRSILEIFTDKKENESAFRQMLEFCQ